MEAWNGLSLSFLTFVSIPSARTVHPKSGRLAG